MSDKFLDKVRALILAIGSLFMLICIQIVSLYAFLFVCRLVFGRDCSKEPVFLAAFHIIYAIIVALVFGLLRKKYTNFTVSEGITNVSDSKTVHVLRLIILGIGIQEFAYGLLNIVYEFAADTEVMKNYNSTISNLNGSTTYLIFVYTLFLAPVAEEIVFRGVVYDAARLSFSFLGTNIIQAVCFGLYHGNIVQFVYAFIIGLVLGFVRHRYGRIRDVIGVHMTVNISGIIIVPVIAYCIMTLVENALIAYSIISICGLIIIIEHIKDACYNSSSIL